MEKKSFFKLLLTVSCVFFVINSYGKRYSENCNNVASVMIQQDGNRDAIYGFEKITGDNYFCTKTILAKPLKMVEFSNNGSVAAQLILIYFINEDCKFLINLLAIENKINKIKNVDNGFLYPTIKLTLSNGETLGAFVKIDQHDEGILHYCTLTISLNDSWCSSREKMDDLIQWHNYLLKKLSTYNISEIKVCDTVFKVNMNLDKKPLGEGLKSAKMIQAMYNWIKSQL